MSSNTPSSPDSAKSSLFLEGYNHNERLSKEGISHRISELDPDEKKQYLNFKSEGAPTVVNNDTNKTYIVHSKPAWYTADGKDYKIIDLVVRGRVDEREAEVLERFNAQVALAKEYSNMAREYIKNEVLPTLLKINNVSCILGRGDIYDPARVPTIDYEHPSDIDLMFFTEGTTDALEVLQKFAEDHPETVVVYQPYKIGKYGYEGKQEVISSHTTENPIVISIDILPLDELLTLVESNSSKILKHISPYVAHTLDRGAVVLKEDLTGKFEKLKQAAAGV